jgi:hypothetical protein
LISSTGICSTVWNLGSRMIIKLMIMLRASSSVHLFHQPCFLCIPHFCAIVQSRFSLSLFCIGRSSVVHYTANHVFYLLSQCQDRGVRGSAVEVLSDCLSSPLFCVHLLLSGYLVPCAHESSYSPCVISVTCVLGCTTELAGRERCRWFLFRWRGTV